MSVEPMPAAQSADRLFGFSNPTKRKQQLAQPLSVYTKPPAMNTRDIFTRWLVLIWSLVLGVTLAGCDPPTPRPPGPMTVGITGYNFTYEGVQEYYVEGNRGSNLPPYGGGGSTSCCVQLPAQWTPEVAVKVSWTIGHYTQPWEKRKHMTVEQENACCWTERTLNRTIPVERYGKEGGGVQVFFLPDDEIKVWVSDLGLGHERHPSGMPYPRKPTEAE